MRYFLILMVLYSCQHSNNILEKKSVDLYYSKLKKYENLNFYDTIQRHELIKIGYGFYTITMHEPQINYGFRLSYDNVNKHQDIKIWWDWFTNNKDILTYQYIDSVFKAQR